MTSQAADGESKPFQCGECGMHLPITPGSTPGALRIACSFCGSRYLGKLWDPIPEHLRGNIRVLGER